MNGQPPVLSHLSTLADGLRVRMLLVLEGQEFPVSEIGEILQLPQSTVSQQEMTVTAAAREDARRRKHVVESRRAKSQEFFSSAAGQWDRLRDELFGQTF